MLQTLEGFLAAPFGKSEPKSNDFETKYKSLVSKKRIHMEACTEIDDTYLVHIKVGSDSNLSVEYDVILHFFTDNPKVKKDVGFRRYYVKFFSNSPSFMYQYAVLYRNNGMMIDMLAEKMDQLYADKLPEKANPNLKVSYDKSIYAACRWMQDHKVSAFSKVGLMAKKKKKAETFFSDVKTFEDIKFDTELSNIGKKLDRQAAKEKKKEDVTKKKTRTKKTAPTATYAKVVRPAKSTTTKAKSVKHVKYAKRK